MNTKRQTIWLVSMLSLMVVLSAYYLFTEDVNKLNVTTDSAVEQNVKVSSEVKDPASAEAVQADAGKTGSSKTDVKANAGTDAKTGTKTADKTDGQTTAKSDSTDGTSKTDAQVLETMKSSAASGEGYFAAQYMKRNEDLAKKTDKLLAIINDQKQSADAVAKANDELDQLQTVYAKIENIEYLLAKDFGNGIVQQTGNKYKVVVQSDSLSRSQAQTIIDTVISELNVTKDAVTVQYVK